jgi:hypothetical protein
MEVIAGGMADNYAGLLSELGVITWSDARNGDIFQQHLPNARFRLSTFDFLCVLRSFILQTDIH